MINITTFVSGIVGWIKRVGVRILEKEFLTNATASLLFEQGVEGVYTLAKYAFTDSPVIELDLSESNRTAYKPLRQVYEAQQYVPLLNSGNDSDIERAKEKLRELNLPGLTDEVIEAGEEEILHVVNRLEEAYEKIALLYRPIALYESLNGEQKKLEDQYIKISAEYRARVEEILGTDIAEIERLAGRKWNGRIDDAGPLAEEAINKAISDGKAWDVVKEFSYVETTDPELKALYDKSEEIKRQIAENEPYLSINEGIYNANVKERDAILEQYGISHEAPTAELTLQEISTSFSETLTQLDQQLTLLTDTTTDYISENQTLSDSVFTLTTTNSELSLLCQNMNAAIQSIPNTIATMAPIYPVCSCGAGSTAGVSDGVSGETSVEDIVSGVVTGVGRMEVKVNEQVFGEMVDRRNNQNLKNALAGRGFSWV